MQDDKPENNNTLFSTVNLSAGVPDLIVCSSADNTVSINHDRYMTIPLKVHYRDQLHEFSLPAECTLKELYQALSKQLVGIDPNGEIMLERQADATYEVNLPPGTY